ncbi:MAG: fibronectin type III domain-containing protein [Candidatus Diapherotrites archaeon]|uniref:Fibronectin type III domain-containing protein n=1 Tax=Candidatus Iainarchaeum sp. TaxID=3101447 RepID=A0A8T4LBC9_9ARCH|nr:fibronectin type III domain-containing protein [Candidatus Diapherotrites archaeon]
MKPTLSFLILFSLCGLLILQGCTTPYAALPDNNTDWIKHTPPVKTFFEKNPEAIINTQPWDRAKLSNNRQLVQQKCVKSLSGERFYFVHLQGEREELYLWFDQDQQIQCQKLEPVGSQIPEPDSNSNRGLFITELKIADLTNQNAVIAWKTSSKSTSVLWFGTDKNNLTQRIDSNVLSIQHSVVMTPLEPAVTYYYRVFSEIPRTDSTSDYNASSEILSFTTHYSLFRSYSTGLFAIEKLEITETGDKTALATWDTNIATTSVVFYGTSPDKLDYRTLGSENAVHHLVQLENLAFGKPYYLRVYSSTNKTMARLPDIAARISSSKPNPIDEALSAPQFFSTNSELDIWFHTRTYAFGLRGPFPLDFSPRIIEYALEMRGETYVGTLPMTVQLVQNDKNIICDFSFDHNSTGKILQQVVYQINPVDSGACYRAKLKPGRYTFSMAIDANNTVMETNELNNSAKQEFTVN